MGIKNKTNKKSAKIKNTQLSVITEFDINDYKLTATDKRIFKLQQIYPELKQVDIAKILKIAEETVSRCVNKPAYKQAWNDYEKDWLSQLADARRKAASRLVGLVDSKDERIAFSASKEILQLNKVDIGFGENTETKSNEISEVFKKMVSSTNFSDAASSDPTQSQQPVPSDLGYH